MPSNIRHFMLLGYLSLALGLTMEAVNFEKSAAAMAGAAKLMIEIYVIAFAIFALVIWLAGTGRKGWARWVFLVLVACGLKALAPVLPSLLKIDPVAAAMDATEIALQAIALFLVFTGNAKDWYRKEQAPL